MRLRRLFVTSLFSLPALLPGAVPVEWSPSDYARAPSHWWAVEVARFPSPSLAAAVEQTLSTQGWAPVQVLERDGGHVVAVGEVDALGAAHFLVRELEAQNLAEGGVVALPRAQHPPRGFTGPVLPPFLATPGTLPEAPPADERAAQEQLRNALLDLSGPEADEAQAALALWLEDKTEEEDFAEGIIAAAQLLWQERVEPGLTYFLASTIARGDWPATAEQRVQAGEVVSDLLYGWASDWRGAWSAARALENHPARSNAGEARDGLRRAALLVELTRTGAHPSPTMGDVRLHLRRLREGIAASETEVAVKIDLVYLQTFAWEGNWDRVEQLGRAFLGDYPEELAERNAARILVAQSLERHRRWDEAIGLLDRVLAQPEPVADRFRYGLEQADLQARARDERARLVALRAEEQAGSTTTEAP